MSLAHFRMLIHEMLNTDPYIYPELAPLIILDGNYPVCMANNGKDNNHTRHIYRIVNLVRNGEKYKMHKIDWCEGNMPLADITTKDVGENYLNTRKKYVMVRLDN